MSELVVSPNPSFLTQQRMDHHTSTSETGTDPQVSTKTNSAGLGLEVTETDREQIVKDQRSPSLKMEGFVKNTNKKRLLVPPLNFCLVEDRIYRSGFPIENSYPFLEQLGLKTIIYLGDLGSEKKSKKADKNGQAEIMENYKAWIATTDIKFHHLPMESSQEPFISDENYAQAKESLRIALQLMLDKNNFPMLIHSNKGKHRIGVLVGLMRKIFQGWCMSGIFEEYEKFALGKSEYDLEFIELWQPELTYNTESKPGFLRCD